MPTQTPDSRRLNSWKEIASFLGRAERTVKRWEAENGLPIHRPVGKAGARVYAETAELSEWLRSSPSAAAPAPAGGEAAHRKRRLALWMTAGGVCAALVVASSLFAGRVIGGPRARAPTGHDARAIEFYREGVHDWSTRTPAGLTRAEDEFTQAIVHDPAYAEAYVGLANTYNLLREYAAMPEAEAYPRAEAAARRAIALDPSLARAHSALGFVLFYWRWDPAGAEREFRMAIRLDARDALPHHWFANVLRCMRKLPDALTEIDTAQGLDPDSSSVLADKAIILDSLGRTVEARRILNQMIAVDPRFASPHGHLADFDIGVRDYADFLAEHREVAGLRNDATQIEIGDAARAGWDKGGAPAMLAAMLKAEQALYAQGRVSAYEVGRTYALMGDRSSARAWLRTAVTRHDPSVTCVLADPTMTSVADDPSIGFLRSAAPANGLPPQRAQAQPIA